MQSAIGHALCVSISLYYMLIMMSNTMSDIYINIYKT